MQIDQEQKEQSYLRGYAARTSANELRSFVSSNSGLRTLITSLIQRYRGTLTKSDSNLLNDFSAFPERLLRLQGMIDSGLRNAFVVETAIRKLDTGIAVPFAIPEGRPVNTKELRRGSCTTHAVRIDVLRTEESPSGISAHTALARTGLLFVASIGTVSLDRRAKIQNEDLHGVSLFIGDDSSCYGFAAGFRGPKLIPLGTRTYFSEQLQENVATVVADARNLSFIRAF